MLINAFSLWRLLFVFRIECLNFITCEYYSEYGPTPAYTYAFLIGKDSWTDSKETQHYPTQML